MLRARITRHCTCCARSRNRETIRQYGENSPCPEVCRFREHMLIAHGKTSTSRQESMVSIMVEQFRKMQILLAETIADYETPEFKKLDGRIARAFDTLYRHEPCDADE